MSSHCPHGTLARRSPRFTVGPHLCLPWSRISPGSLFVFFFLLLACSHGSPMVGHGDRACSEQWGHWSILLGSIACNTWAQCVLLFLFEVNSKLAMTVTQLERMSLTDRAFPVWDREKCRRKERRFTALLITQPVRHCTATHSQ